MSFKSANRLLLYDQNQCYTQHGGHLEKGAILDFLMDTTLQDIIPIAFNIYRRTPGSFKLAEFMIFLGPTPTCRWKNGDHLEKRQSGSCDQKHQLNVCRKFHHCIIILIKYYFNQLHYYVVSPENT